jgi:hypothetical protein
MQPLRTEEPPRAQRDTPSGSDLQSTPLVPIRDLQLGQLVVSS